MVYREGGSEYFASDNPGSYTVTAVLDESWRDKLKATRDELTLMPLGQMNELDQEQISRIMRGLGQIKSLLDAEMQPVSCSGRVDDAVSGYAVVKFTCLGTG